MAPFAFPYFFEDSSGRLSGPTEFLDIYDRPPFLRLESVVRHKQPSGVDLAIFELGARTFVKSALRHPTPSVVISLHGAGLRGSIKFRTGLMVQLERWLKKSSTFGSTLTRQFDASDGMCYQWSCRNAQEHEWECIQMCTGHLIAHYDLKPAGESPAHGTSGNVLTIYQKWVPLAVEVLASLVIMRHIHADVSEACLNDSFL